MQIRNDYFDFINVSGFKIFIWIIIGKEMFNFILLLLFQFIK